MLGRRRPTLLSPFAYLWGLGAGLERIGVRCLCLAVLWEVAVALPLQSGSMLVCLVDQPLAHPQSRYLVCPGVDFKDLWVSLICYGLWWPVSGQGRCLALLPHSFGLVGGQKGKPGSHQGYTCSRIPQPSPCPCPCEHLYFSCEYPCIQRSAVMGRTHTGGGTPLFLLHTFLNLSLLAGLRYLWGWTMNYTV